MNFDVKVKYLKLQKFGGRAYSNGENNEINLILVYFKIVYFLKLTKFCGRAYSNEKNNETNFGILWDCLLFLKILNNVANKTV